MLFAKGESAESIVIITQNTTTFYNFKQTIEACQKVNVNYLLPTIRLLLLITIYGNSAHYAYYIHDAIQRYQT